jgi:hypothetical protein
MSGYYLMQVGPQKLGTLCAQVALGYRLHQGQVGHPSHANTEQVRVCVYQSLRVACDGERHVMLISV